ncbi:MAG: hypothetical protein DWC06_00530 [Candidatus Poseidoniales archaeon]|nr:MAG: hypothetical protein DWC06_00530 [Candidatus Poseidoniales archaeon]|tara:strand:- start:48 stop:302 length:255 start_codon:yes stop_codon:yes gene_type:complete
MTESKLEKLMSNKLVKSFIIFSIFRAFYGTGILIVTWLLATETDGPWWYSLIFLAFSMVFSRVLFKWIKSLKKDNSNQDLPSDM